VAERTSAETRLKEAQNLAISAELLNYCDAQRAFIDSGESRDEVRQFGRHLAREARRRRILPETLLLAMQIAGCHRSHEFYGEKAYDALSRYHETLAELLFYFFGPESRPAERRMSPRSKRPKGG